MTARRHPDAALIESARHALDAWAAHSASHPTSQLLGGGAIAAAEALISARVAGRRAILTTSASWGLLVALRAVGVSRGNSVLMPRDDWVSSRSAAELLGARPILVYPGPTTGLIDPAKAARLRNDSVSAVVVSHLGGQACDVPTLRRLLPGIPIIEDCAQAWEATLGDRPVGTMGDVAVFSFSAFKDIDCGEIAAIVPSDELFDTVLRLTVHPARLMLETGESRPLNGLAPRPDPVAAIRLWHQLEQRGAASAPLADPDVSRW